MLVLFGHDFVSTLRLVCKFSKCPLDLSKYRLPRLSLGCWVSVLGGVLDWTPLVLHHSQVIGGNHPAQGIVEESLKHGIVLLLQ